MSLKIILKTLRMAREDQQLAEMLIETAAAGEGQTLLFPEYGAYTVEGSRTAYKRLSQAARDHGVSVVTSLNLPSGDLPCANPNVNYNTLFIFSRNGQVYSPQAKITPQSFETRHLDKSYPRMNVAPYSCLNKVTLRQNDQTYAAFFLSAPICTRCRYLNMTN